MVAETGCPGDGFGSPRGRASARVVPVSIHFPASGTGTRSLDGIRRPRLARNIIFEVTQTAFRGSTVPENLNASQFRQTSDPHNTPHRTLHAAINTIAWNVVPSSPPRQRSCIKQVRGIKRPTIILVLEIGRA